MLMKQQVDEIRSWCNCYLMKNQVDRMAGRQNDNGPSVIKYATEKV
jgi:hypothetical protein